VKASEKREQRPGGLCRGSKGKNEEVHNPTQRGGKLAKRFQGSSRGDFERPSKSLRKERGKLCCWWHSSIVVETYYLKCLGPGGGRGITRASVVCAKRADSGKKRLDARSSGMQASAEEAPGEKGGANDSKASGIDLRALRSRRKGGESISAGRQEVGDLLGNFPRSKEGGVIEELKGKGYRGGGRLERERSYPEGLPNQSHYNCRNIPSLTKYNVGRLKEGGKSR